MAGSPAPRRNPRRRAAPPRRACPCGKACYRDRIAALAALAGTAAKDGSRRPKTETRAYRCPASGLWHLTSQPPRTG